MPTNLKDPGDCSSTKPKLQGFIQKWKKVPLPAYTYTESILKNYNKDTKHFWRHILSSGRINTYDRRWVPVCHRLIRRDLRNTDYDALLEDNLLEMKEANRAKRLSREWRIPLHIQRQYDKITCDSLQDTKVDLFTGRRTVKKQKTEYYDESRNPIPDLIRDSLKEIPYGLFNDIAVRRHLTRLRRMRDASQRKVWWIKQIYEANSPKGQQTQRQAEKAGARYSNDLRCYESLINQHPEQWKDNIYQFRMAYRLQESGRVSHIGGGVQSCSREMKEAVYKDIDGVRNYDIKSSQAYILIDFLEEAHLDPSWLKRYIHTPNAKHIFARKAGLPVDVWKGCLYAVFMGATLPLNIETSEGDIRKMILGAVDSTQLKATYERFRRVIGPLYNALREWHEYLDSTWTKQNKYPACGGWFVSNDTGSTMKLNKLKSKPPHERRGKLAAFLLQGREAAFIHTLTKLSKRYNFRVIANEHDGLVSIGEIPKSAIETAQEIRSMEYVKLVEKNFV